MSAWEDFLDDVFGHPNKPGKVMICFVNRYLEGMDDVKYKIKYDGHEKSGTTTAQHFCIEFTPESFTPVQTFVWSRQARHWKKLDDVVAVPGRMKLVRKMLKTFKVPAKTEPLPDAPPTKPRPNQPAPAPAPAPSPAGDQGIKPDQGKNENGQPQARPERAVPGEISVAQLRKIFPKNKGGKPTDAHLQAIADELNTDLAKYKLDTPIRRAHFFGQIKRESPLLSGAAESFNHTMEGLINTFGYYGKHRNEAGEDGRLEQKLSDGKKKIIQAAKQEVIANKAYGPDGNDSLGNNQTGDGWRYRGRGVHQTTGRYNYRQFTKSYPKYWSGYVDFEDNPDLLAQMPYTLRSAVAFWLDHECWQDADTGITDTAIDAVSKKINSGEVKKHNAHRYSDPKKDPVLLRRQYVKLAYAAFT